MKSSESFQVGAGACEFETTVTVPLVTALGVGLATTIRGRNPLVDGFGLIALASLLPMVFVMVYGMVLF